MDGLSLIRAETLNKGKRATRARTSAAIRAACRSGPTSRSRGTARGLELPALLQFHAETTRDLTDGGAVSFAIASEQVRVGQGKGPSQ
jgi:hypothetical protein